MNSKALMKQLNKFLNRLTRLAGKPLAFIFAFSFVIFWIIVGFIWGFSIMWMLILDTVATVVAALMVFVIQNTQNRESRALHLKIDELIRVTKEAERELIAIEEEMEEEELERIRRKFFENLK